MPLTGYTDETFTESGFSNCQKALKKFSKHEQLSCHRHAVNIVLQTSQDVGDMLCSVYSSVPEVRTSVEAFYRQTYYGVIHYVVQTIRARFDQNGYKSLGRLEQLLSHHNANVSDFDDVLKLPEEIENEKGGQN